MKLIVGLGNPGKDYSETRHNIGKKIIETVAKRQSLLFSTKKALKSSIATFKTESLALIYAHPETYMNVSGEAVRLLVDYYHIDIEKDLLVIIDDVSIPFGALRLRGKGSSGGHNGLKSIEHHLGTQGYARLRIGIGVDENQVLTPRPQGEQSLERYVLDRFNVDEKKSLIDLIDRSIEACQIWINQPIEAAMSVVNH